MKIIALCGYSKCGKDYVATQILNHISNGCRYALANPLKEMLADTLGVSLEWIEEYKDMVVFRSKTVRQMLIDMSEKAIKKHVPEFWCRPMDRAINTAKAQGKDYMIITDIRYWIEVGYLRQLCENKDIYFIEINTDAQINKNCGYELSNWLTEKFIFWNKTVKTDIEWLNLDEHQDFVKQLKRFIRN